MSDVWIHFRRLLLGTVVEALRDVGIRGDLADIELTFDDRSRFDFPRLDNHMRFSGHAGVRVLEVPGDDTLASLERRLEQVWPGIVAATRIPVGDRLDVERNEVKVELSGDLLRVSFDLVAD